MNWININDKVPPLEEEVILWLGPNDMVFGHREQDSDYSCEQNDVVTADIYVYSFNGEIIEDDVYYWMPSPNDPDEQTFV